MTRMLAAVIVVLCWSSLAEARSKAATYLIEEALARACEYNGGTGTISDDAVIERDLTGDGKADLIISDEGITCADGSRSGFCGVQVCSFTIYVRRGALFEHELEMLGGGVSVTGDGVPRIEMYAHGGSRHSIRWNGRAFK